MPKTLTGRYTDVMRTAAVSMGHGIALIGAAGKVAGIPGAQVVERVGNSISTKAVEQCSRDTPLLERCNK